MRAGYEELHLYLLTDRQYLKQEVKANRHQDKNGEDAVTEEDIFEGHKRGVLDLWGICELSGQFQLVLNQFVIIAFLVNEFGMCALFYHAAMTQYDDLIGVFDRGETMGNDHTGSSGEETVEIVGNAAFVFGIQG